jgi:hypothetical protein
MRLPTRKVFVVFPTPPLGLITEIVLGRLTAGWVRMRPSMSASSVSPLETRNRAIRSRRRRHGVSLMPSPSTTGDG